MNQRLQIRNGILKRMREATGIASESAQARMLGVSLSSIRRIDAGEQPSANFIIAFCTSYNLGLGEAFEIVNTASLADSKAA